jgi:putative ABC transport system permease protein
MPRQDLGTSSIVPRLHEVGIDGTVLLFAFGVSVVAGLACGLAPALWQSRVEAHGELAREAVPALGFCLLRRSRGRALLVVVQIGLAVVLLLASGLLIRSLLKLSNVNPGYATTRVLTFQVALPPKQSALSFSADLVARLQGLPAVRAAGYADHLPLSQQSRTRAAQYAFPAEPVHGSASPAPSGCDGKARLSRRAPGQS